MNWTADDLRQLRCRLGWSQGEMARSLGCGFAEVGGWELGANAPNSDQLQQMMLFYHQVENNSEKMHRRPLAESLMAIQGLCQIHDAEVLNCLANGDLRSFNFLEK